MEIRVLFPARFNRAIRVIRAIIRYIIFNSAVLITPSGVVFKQKHPCYPLNPCSINNFRVICGNSCSNKTSNPCSNAIRVSRWLIRRRYAF